MPIAVQAHPPLQWAMLAFVLLACGPDPDGVAAQAYLQEVQATHRAWSSVSFTRRKSAVGTPRDYSRMKDRWVRSAEGPWRREIRDYVWGEDETSWWGWSDRSNSLYRENLHPEPMHETTTHTRALEPNGPILPPLRELDRDFVATHAFPQGGLTIVTATSREPWEAWWDQGMDGRQRAAVLEVTMVFDADHMLLATERRVQGDIVFSSTYEDYVIDDPRVNATTFASPVDGRPPSL